MDSPWQNYAGVQAIAASADGRLLATGSTDKTARIWNVESGDAVGAPLVHQDTVRDIAFSSDSRVVITGSFDKTARRWHAATGISIGPSFRHRERIRSVALSPDRRTAGTASYDGTAILWEAPDALVGPPEQLTKRIQFVTGIELDEFFNSRTLETTAWQALREGSATSVNIERP
jgi:WD40 repeat protein